MYNGELIEQGDTLSAGEIKRVSGIPFDSEHRKFRLIDSTGTLIAVESELEGTSTTHTFTKGLDNKPLKDGTDYYVETWAQDYAGNDAVISTRLGPITTDKIPEFDDEDPDSNPIKIVETPEGWTNGEKRATIKYLTEEAEKYNVLLTSDEGREDFGTNPTVRVTLNNTEIKAILTDRTSKYEVANDTSTYTSSTVTTIDTTAPTDTAPTISDVTTYSMKVTCNQQDQGNGNDGSGISSVIYKVATDENMNNVKATYPNDGTTTTALEHTFEGLTQKQTYYVQTYVEDAVTSGTKNSATSRVSSTETGEVPGVSITVANPDTWKKEKKITFTTTTGYELWIRADTSLTNGGTASEYVKQDGTTAELILKANTTVYAYAQDPSGQQTAQTATKTVTKVDSTTPGTPTVSNPSGGNWTNSNVNITITTSEDVSSIAKYEYSADGNTWTQGSGTITHGSGTTYTIAHTESTEGEYTRYFRVYDDAQNVSESSAGTNIKLDKTSPTDTIPTATTTTYSVTVTYTQADQGTVKSEIPDNKTYRKYRLTNSAGTTGNWVEDNSTTHTFSGLTHGSTYYVQTYAKDLAGNEQLSKVKTVTIGSLPSIDISIANADSWVSTATGKVATATSARALVSGETLYVSTSSSYASGSTWTTTSSQTVNTTAIKTNNTVVYAKITDASGQAVNAATKTVTKLDGDNPTVSATVTHKNSSGTATSTGWGYTAEVSVTGTDGTSPVTILQYSANGSSGWTNFKTGGTTTTTTGTRTFSSNTSSSGTTEYYRALDSASRNSTNASVAYKIDRDTPTTTAPTVSSVTTNSITINFNQEDALSGIQTSQYSTDGGTTWANMGLTAKGTYTITKLSSNTGTDLSDGTNYSIKTRCYDKAGNGGTATAAVTGTTETARPTTANIGWKTNYTSLGWEGEWRIFYVDTTNVYLISDWFVGYGDDLNEHYATTQPTSNPAWNDYISTEYVTFNSSYNSHKATAYFMTGSNWTKYKDKSRKASWAMGTVPLEMYVASLKATNHLTLGLTGGTYGYAVSGGTTAWDISSEWNHGIYCLSSAYVALAAPHIQNTNYLWEVETVRETVLRRS